MNTITKQQKDNTIKTSQRQKVITIKKIDEAQGNGKKLRQVINNATDRKMKKNMTEEIKITEGNQTTANTLNSYFKGIGSKIVRTI